MDREYPASLAIFSTETSVASRSARRNVLVVSIGYARLHSAQTCATQMRQGVVKLRLFTQTVYNGGGSCHRLVPPEGDGRFTSSVPLGGGLLVSNVEGLSGFCHTRPKEGHTLLFDHKRINANPRYRTGTPLARSPRREASKCGRTTFHGVLQSIPGGFAIQLVRPVVDLPFWGSATNPGIKC